MDLPPEHSNKQTSAPRPASDPSGISDPERAAALFQQSVAIMARLRAPGGCPWDREQSFDSIRKYTLEETYEVFDAIERRDWPHLAEELGDLLLQVLFYAEMAANDGHFTIADVLDHLNNKLIRRHPHVFGEEASRAAGNRADVDADVEGSSSAVLRNWEEIKAAEALHAAAAPSAALHAAGAPSAQKPPSRLDSVQRAMPALAEAAKLGAKARKAGFDWPEWRDLLPKLAEETAELEAEAASDDPARKPAVEAELGDLLFTVVNLGRHLGVDAEMALRGCNQRFRERFRAMELASERPLEELSAVELEELWVNAKRKLADAAANP
jgi:MazG family protein